MLFYKGFLLNKVVHKENAKCDNVIKMKEKIEFSQILNSNESYCFETRTRVILLVFDSLRYDFGVYNKSLTEETAVPFQNNLKIFYELCEKFPKNTRLYKFIADPPTVTLQRLKGLTTGTLPTFIDVASNFATPEINEDNIIDQLVASGKRAVFMGDNTWTDLFPNRFSREYSYPSLNNYDLDSIDRGKILTKIFTLLRKSSELYDSQTVFMCMLST